MIVIVNSTNRVGNKSIFFAKAYQAELEKNGEEVALIDLATLPQGALDFPSYNWENVHESVKTIRDKFMAPSNKFVFVIPEYNGSFPGALKSLVDALSLKERDGVFKGKKAALVGTAAGRAGNLRGMDHFTGVLNYLGTHVMPNRLPYSSINALLKNDKVSDKGTLDVLATHAKEIINF